MTARDDGHDDDAASDDEVRAEQPDGARHDIAHSGEGAAARLVPAATSSARLDRHLDFSRLERTSRLERLLLTSFDDHELRRFVRHALGQAFVDALPGKSASAAEKVHALVAALVRHGEGVLGPRFFGELLATRPHREGEIRALAQACGVQPQVPEHEAPQGTSTVVLDASEADGTAELLLQLRDLDQLMAVLALVREKLGDDAVTVRRVRLGSVVLELGTGPQAHQRLAEQGLRLDLERARMVSREVRYTPPQAQRRVWFFEAEQTGLDQEVVEGLLALWGGGQVRLCHVDNVGDTLRVEVESTDVDLLDDVGLGLARRDWEARARQRRTLLADLASPRPAEGEDITDLPDLLDDSEALSRERTDPFEARPRTAALYDSPPQSFDEFLKRATRAGLDLPDPIDEPVPEAWVPGPERWLPPLVRQRLEKAAAAWTTEPAPDSPHAWVKLLYRCDGTPADRRAPLLAAAVRGLLATDDVSSVPDSVLGSLADHSHADGADLAARLALQAAVAAARPDHATPTRIALRLLLDGDPDHPVLAGPAARVLGDGWHDQLVALDPTDLVAWVWREGVREAGSDDPLDTLTATLRAARSLDEVVQVLWAHESLGLGEPERLAAELEHLLHSQAWSESDERQLLRLTGDLLAGAEGAHRRRALEVYGTLLHRLCDDPAAPSNMLAHTLHNTAVLLQRDDLAGAQALIGRAHELLGDDRQVRRTHQLLHLRGHAHDTPAHPDWRAVVEGLPTLDSPTPEPAPA